MARAEACANFDLYIYYTIFSGGNVTRFRIYLMSESNELGEKGEVLLLTRNWGGRDLRIFGVPGLKPCPLDELLRGAEAPLFHVTEGDRDATCIPFMR